jgi:hypothetical protein
VLVVLERISSGFAGFGVVVVVVVEPVAVVVAVVDGLTVALVVTTDIVVAVVTAVVVTGVVVPQAAVMSERATKPAPIKTRHRIDLPDSQFFIFLLNIPLDSVQKKRRP